MKKNTFIYSYNNLLSKHIGDKNGFSVEDINKLLPKINNAYNFAFDNPIINTQEIYNSINNNDLQDIKITAEKVRKCADAFVVFGIGGSALGANAIFKALKHFRYNELSKEKRNGPRFYVEDNIDPVRLQALLDVLDLKKTYFCIVSKSGNTVETLTQFFMIRQMLEDLVGEKWKEHFIILTDDNQGKLNSFAIENNLKRFFIPKDLGGRYSVFSAVGLFPSAVLGLDIDALLLGAREMYEASKNTDVWQNAPLLSASLDYLNYKNGKCMSILIPYSESLELVGNWYCQLWAESLGRTINIDNQPTQIGQTPIKEMGTSAQHSQFQMYLEGPTDKIITFIAVKNFKNDIPLNKDLDILFGQEVCKNRTFGDLFNIERIASTISLTAYNRPNETITISEISEETLGKIFMFFILKTLFMGSLLGVSPYNQPAVESIKIGVKAILKCDTSEIPLRKIEI